MIPYTQIDTIFLDSGNTLISIDFDWVASELASRRLVCLPDALRRAEAAARPQFSQRLFVDGISEGVDLFGAYLFAMFSKLDATTALPASDLESLVAELGTVLRPDGRASDLWRSVMPRVPDALAKLRDLGVTLAVVSNSDGTAERSLEAAGLRSYLSVVIDSTIAGYEKPDPRIFHRAIEACGAQPDRTLHVGDLYHADVAGARGAGLHALLLDPFHDWPSLDCERAPDLWAVADLVARSREHPAV
ncbi:MAG: HAD-IA family hydrolase [Luteitalea sp.]|nr:HAD-IA family hydrolase [Luteitalea sp.]